MNITTKSRYALRGVLDIARHQGEDARPVRRVDIGSRQGFSQDYLEQLLVRMREAGIVEAVRGPGGGYRLLRTPEEISVWEIIEAVEDRVETVPCLLDDRPDCDHFIQCGGRQLWRHLRNVIRRELKSISLADILSGKFAAEGEEPLGLEITVGFNHPRGCASESSDS